jgi:hypothetical protein
MSMQPWGFMESKGDHAARQAIVGELLTWSALRASIAGLPNAKLPGDTVRIVSNDAEATRYYQDSATGELVHMVDRDTRWFRWLHLGLRRMDFTQRWRSRPFWELWMWLMLSGAVVICATGVWLGVKR